MRLHLWSSLRAERSGVEESRCVTLKSLPRNPSTLARDDNVPVVVLAPPVPLSLVSISVSVAAKLVLDFKVRASDFGELRLKTEYAIT